ncbi:MAG: sugar-transfer associated ATP-grasp domain-containing protein [Verrucomicrobiota bacterium]
MRQLWELLVFSLFHGFQPSEYYERKLYDEPILAEIGVFLSEYDTKALAVATNGPSAESVKSKLRFDQACRAAGLPVAPTFAFLEPDANTSILSGESIGLPKADIFFKPVYGMEGIGIERWDYHGETDQWSYNETTCAEDALRQHFYDLSTKQSYVLQKALRNHPEVADLSPGGLITYRLVSVSDNVEDPVVIASHMSLPRHLTTTNHESNGGIEAEIDLATFELDAGYSFIPKHERHETHPTTGVRIKGRVAKEWPLLESLALQLHALFPDVSSIGWDIAYTTEGPIVLEGNTFWGLHNGMYLGKTAYVRRCLNVIRSSNSVKPQSAPMP